MKTATGTDTSVQQTQATPAKRSIFQIGADLEAIAALIDERDGDISDPEVEAAINQWLGEFQQEQGKKADGYISMIRRYESEEAAATAEKEQYAKIAQVRANRVKALKGMLQAYMQQTGQEKIVTATARTIALQKNGQAPVEMDQPRTDETLRWVEDELNARLQELIGTMRLPANGAIDALRYARVKIDIDGTRVRDELKAGKVLSFARMLPAGQHIRIR